MIAEPAAEGLDAAWASLRRQIDRSQQFWLGIVCCESRTAADSLRDRAELHSHSRGHPFKRVEFVDLQDLGRILIHFEDAPGPGGCTWVSTEDWGILDPRAAKACWTQALYRLNQKRDSLQSTLGGLVLAGPAWLNELASTEASDLWSVRSLVVYAKAKPSGL
ncbi:MAG: hypothetical protein LBJ08_06645, partial [Bifidobacteriaceae bacterium]|nr:hypothetical protein [Bifidobacteriaceae bacterium]